MWECLKSVLLLMASRGPAPLVMNMSLHLSSFMNSQSFFLIFLRCSRTLHHVKLVDCNVNSPRTSLHCKKQTINRQTHGFLMDGLHLMTKFTLCNWQMWKGGPLGHGEVALLKWVNKHTSKYSTSRILSKLKLWLFIFLLENHCPWNACTVLMHTDWPVTVLHSLKDTTKWEKIYRFRQTLFSSESIMKISLLRDSEAFGSEKVKPMGGFLKATLFLIATRGRNLWLQKKKQPKEKLNTF